MPNEENFSNTALPAKSASALNRLYYSPVLIVAAVIICTLASEALVMVVLSQFSLLNDPLHHILDSIMLLALLFPVLVMLVFRPIDHHLTERRRVEEELQTEQNKLKAILDALPAGVCIVNRDHEIEYLNSSLIKEFGHIEGQFCHDYFQGRFHSCPNCQMDDVLSGKSVTREYHSEKTGKIYETFETPLRNRNGSVSLLVIVHDVTERKTAEDELRISRERMRALSVHLQRAREEERTAISREIHDELGQVLATVQLGVTSLADDYHDHRHLVDKIAEMEKMLAGAIKSVQRISAQLRPAILDELGLSEAIEWQADEFRKNTGIDCTSDLLPLETEIGKDVATAIFRIFQEALTNVMRHSGATSVKVSLAERGRRIVLVVEDNGCGVAPERVRNNSSLGITGMRERANALGGRVTVRSLQEGGTVVMAHIPIDLTGDKI